MVATSFWLRAENTGGALPTCFKPKPVESFLKGCSGRAFMLLALLRFLDQQQLQFCNSNMQTT